MKIRYIASFIFLACIANSCLEDVFSGSENQTPGFNVSDVITGAATVDGELVPYGKPMPTKALIDKETTRNLDSYFLRMDEDIASDGIAGLYTFKGASSGISSDNYYPNSYLLMAQTIASPDNETERFRSITFSPSQSYKTRMVRRGTTDVFDTTHFYHTRMVGFYPREKFLPTSEFPTNPEGGLANVQLSRFLSQGRYKMVGEQTWIKFTGLSAGDDLMVTDLKEAQQWHDPSPTLSPGAAKDNGHYAQPYGFNRALPSYKNYFTFHHLRSAVRVSVTASSPEQNMTIWGKIKGVTIQNQPADCWVKLPETLNGYPGSSDVEWISESRSSVQLIEDEAIFGNDSNHSNLSELPPYDSKHEISLDGLAYNVGKKIYLGYSCIVPGEDLTLELHTTSGIYTVTIPHTYNAVEVFRPSYFYNVVLDLKTEGTVSAILENEENEYYYDLTSYRTLDSQSGVKENGFSNCYIVDPTSTEITTSLASLNSKLTSQGQTNISHYSGYAFCATNIGNGQAGILSYGAQTLYPASAIIEPVDARLIWETSHGLIRDVVLLHDYVRFKLSPEAAAGTAYGNAVIGVYDKQGNVLWSWHLWVGKTPSEVNVGGNIFMDRNLGATAALTSDSDNLNAFGLYYQWGRKDPSMYPPTSSYNRLSMNTSSFYDYDAEEHTANERKNFASPTVENGIRYPQYLILPTISTIGYFYNWIHENNTLLWGYIPQEGSMQKTIYDPCPLGWRVPGTELVDAIMSNTVVKGTYAHKVGNMYLPYVGYKGDDYDSNSLNFEWKHVGDAGDYQTAVINSNGHRQRILVSKNATFTDLVGNVEHKYGTTIASDKDNTWIGGTNRRTAAVIRCVKDTPFSVVNSDFVDGSGNHVDFLLVGETTIAKLNFNLGSGSSVSFANAKINNVSAGIVQNGSVLTITCSNANLTIGYNKAITVSFDVTVDGRKTSISLILNRDVRKYVEFRIQFGVISNQPGGAGYLYEAATYSGMANNSLQVATLNGSNNAFVWIQEQIEIDGSGNTVFLLKNKQTNRYVVANSGKTPATCSTGFYFLYTTSNRNYAYEFYVRQAGGNTYITTKKDMNAIANKSWAAPFSLNPLDRGSNPGVILYEASRYEGDSRVNLTYP